MDQDRKVDLIFYRAELNKMVGIDIVHLPEFKKRFKNVSLEKVFLPIELSQNVETEGLAGVFAAKEAFFKALGKKENWLDVWIEKDRNGNPTLYSSLVKSYLNLEVSISHQGEYAIAVVLIWEH